MRRLIRRRRSLTALTAIMGRLGKSTQGTTKPIFRVHYRKLVDEYSQHQEQLKFMPALPDYMSYCCCRCGHMQKLEKYPSQTNTIRISILKTESIDEPRDNGGHSCPFSHESLQETWNELAKATITIHHQKGMEQQNNTKGDG
ncbi:hypothetical protein KQX54_010190 [Cotesia glomerata]|uniref:Uncharacterized protein n=1 Tax=Cotesia glomerata TaxID=32391 RepID=A0AAV7J915_COTGL|nr:hypothetical protein KQX54_010190 [Cotesia glomerata]